MYRSTRRPVVLPRQRKTYLSSRYAGVPPLLALASKAFTFPCLSLYDDTVLASFEDGSGLASAHHTSTVPKATRSSVISSVKGDDQTGTDITEAKSILLDKLGSLVKPHETQKKNSKTSATTAVKTTDTTSSEVTEQDMMVELPRAFDTHEKENWLTPFWDLAKLFQLNLEFSSREFCDYVAYVALEAETFEAKYLKSTQSLSDNLGDALDVIEKLYQDIIKLRIFGVLNVYRLRSSGTVCSLETVIAFEDFRKHQKKFDRTIETFEQMLRSVNNCEQLIKKDARVRARAPYLRMIRATPASRLALQEKAENKAQRAASLLQEAQAEYKKLRYRQHTEWNEGATQSLPDNAIEKAKENIRRYTLQKLYWQAVDNNLNPLCFKKQDKRLMINNYLGVSSETSSAMLKSIETTGTAIWKRYEAEYYRLENFEPPGTLIDKAFFWRGKDSIRTPLNYPWPPFPIQSWKDCHAYAVDAVERISPTLAENLRAMQREGRLLWVDSPGVVCDMFNAGQEAGQFLLLRFRNHPVAFNSYVAAYATGSIDRIANPDRLVSPCKSIFQSALVEFIADQAAWENSNMLFVSTLRKRNFEASLEVLKGLQLAFAFDQFEDSFQRLVDSVAHNRASQRNPRTHRDAFKASVNQLYHDHVVKRLVVSPKPSAKPLPFNTELYNFLHQVPSSSLLTSVGRFNMDRGNYKTLTAILAKCALQHALTNPDGTLKPIELREARIHKLLSLPASSTFDDYVEALGGRPRDTRYWSDVLTSIFEHDLRQVTSLIDKTVPLRRMFFPQ